MADDNGNLNTQTDAENQTAPFSYDFMNRLIGKLILPMPILLMLLIRTIVLPEGNYGLDRWSPFAFGEYRTRLTGLLNPRL